MRRRRAERKHGGLSLGGALPWLGMAAMAAAALWPRPRGAPAARAPSPHVPTPAELDALEPGRGRCANWPFLIPPLGWKDIAWRTWREFGRARLPSLAGGVTFFLVLATFPAIAAFVSLYGLFSDVTSVEAQLPHLVRILPGDVISLIAGQMVRIATQRRDTLSLAFVVSTLLSVWSANAGMRALVDGIDITYEETEKRDYFTLSFLTYAATLAALVFLGLVISVLIAAPVFFHDIGLERLGVWWALTRWLAAYLIAAVFFGLLYRYGPSRRHAKARWVVFGAMFAAAVWLAVSYAFSYYVDNIAHFGVTYGSLSALIAYMVWIWITATVVLAGAELNAEIEHQTAVDTTIGPSRLMGQRGAVMADTVGRAFTTSPAEAAAWVWDQVRRPAGDLARWLRLKRSPRP